MLCLSALRPYWGVYGIHCRILHLIERFQHFDKCFPTKLQSTLSNELIPHSPWEMTASSAVSKDITWNILTLDFSYSQGKVSCHNILPRATSQGAPSYGGVRTQGGLEIPPLAVL